MAHSDIKKTGHAASVEVASQDHQEHPLKVYFIVWGLLFVLSLGSYLVDILGFETYLRWSLILFFMFFKAGLILAVFMYMKWERLSLNYAVLLPPIAVLVFVGIMVYESDYTVISRAEFFNTQ